MNEFIEMVLCLLLVGLVCINTIWLMGLKAVERTSISMEVCFQSIPKEGHLNQGYLCVVSMSKAQLRRNQNINTGGCWHLVTTKTF